MKFTSRQVADPAAQQNFEQLQLLFPLKTASIADGAVTIPKLAIGTVLELAVAGTQRKVAFGTNSVTWPGVNANSNVTTVTHGLSVAPLVVLLTPDDAGTFRFVVLASTARTATTFSVQGQTNDTTTPAAATAIGFDWLAIG